MAATKCKSAARRRCWAGGIWIKFLRQLLPNAFKKKGHPGPSGVPFYEMTRFPLKFVGTPAENAKHHNILAGLPDLAKGVGGFERDGIVAVNLVLISRIGLR